MNPWGPGDSEDECYLTSSELAATTLQDFTRDALISMPVTLVAGLFLGVIAPRLDGPLGALPALSEFPLLMAGYGAALGLSGIAYAFASLSLQEVASNPTNEDPRVPRKALAAWALGRALFLFCIAGSLIGALVTLAGRSAMGG